MTIDGFTTEQKAALGSGADFWTTKAVGDVPSIMMTDGPHGLRKQEGDTDHLGLSAQRAGHLLPARRRARPDLGSGARRRRRLGARP